jgi:hypothetical protein
MTRTGALEPDGSGSLGPGAGGHCKAGERPGLQRAVDSQLHGAAGERGLTRAPGACGGARLAMSDLGESLAERVGVLISMRTGHVGRVWGTSGGLLPSLFLLFLLATPAYVACVSGPAAICLTELPHAGAEAGC